LKANAENKRMWHPNFLKYTDDIVGNKNYEGLFYERGADKKVKWVVAGKSEKGQKRRAWWDIQCQKYGIKIEAGCYAKVALLVHPTKMHTCQICGRELSIKYIYPNSRLIGALRKDLGIEIEPFTKNIYEIVEDCTSNEIEKVKKIFRINSTEILSKETLNEYLQNNYVNVFAKGLLSPGAMSNSPDRFDGYHSDGACCRHDSDKGTSQIKLATVWTGSAGV
jgi:hypothetical protein